MLLTARNTFVVVDHAVGLESVEYVGVAVEPAGVGLGVEVESDAVRAGAGQAGGLALRRGVGVHVGASTGGETSAHHLERVHTTCGYDERNYCNLFKNVFGGHMSYFGALFWISGFLVTSLLGFKARVG